MTESEQTILWNRIYGACSEILEHAPQCHDFRHTLRVLRNAECLLREEKSPCNPFAVRVGALLHDVARPEELSSGGKLCHAELGAEKSAVILRQCGCSDETFIHVISDIVRKHRYRGQAIPETIEERIVYDADKLDSLGAFGIARAFHFAGRVGACIHNSMEEALKSAAYSEQDSAYREYLVKLRHLPEKMLTEPGRRIGRIRAKYMTDFFDRLNRENDPENFCVES